MAVNFDFAENWDELLINRNCFLSHTSAKIIHGNNRKIMSGTLSQNFRLSDLTIVEKQSSKRVKGDLTSLSNFVELRPLHCLEKRAQARQKAPSRYFDKNQPRKIFQPGWIKSSSSAAYFRLRKLEIGIRAPHVVDYFVFSLVRKILNIVE